MTMRAGWGSVSISLFLFGSLLIGPAQVLLLTCGMTVGESCPSFPSWPVVATGVAFIVLGVLVAIFTRKGHRARPRVRT